MNKSPSAAQRKRVFSRAKGICEYCQSLEKYSNATFEVEHISPFSKGGKTVLTNLALACSGCNKYKGNRISAIDLQTGETVLLYNPRKDVWREHFAWSEDFMEIKGLTPKGRATINALKLNRRNLLSLRRIVRLVGEHTPKYKSK